MISDAVAVALKSYDVVVDYVNNVNAISLAAIAFTIIFIRNHILHKTYFVGLCWLMFFLTIVSGLVAQQGFAGDLAVAARESVVVPSIINHQVALRFQLGFFVSGIMLLSLFILGNKAK